MRFIDYITLQVKSSKLDTEYFISQEKPLYTKISRKLVSNNFKIDVLDSTLD